MTDDRATERLRAERDIAVSSRRAAEAVVQDLTRFLAAMVMQVEGRFTVTDRVLAMVEGADLSVVRDEPGCRWVLTCEPEERP